MLHRCYRTVYNKSHLKMLYAIRFLVLEDLLCSFGSVDSRAACRLFIYHCKLFDKGTIDTGVFYFWIFGFLIYWQPESLKVYLERIHGVFIFLYIFLFARLDMVARKKPTRGATVTVPRTPKSSKSSSDVM